MKLARIGFLVAGIYGILALTPQYFGEAFIGRKFPPPITHPEYFYGFIGVVIVFHLMFLMISKDPMRYRPLMLIAAAEKFVFGVPTALLYVQQRVAAPIAIAALIDIAFGMLFLVAHRATGNVQSPSAFWQPAR
ncbi:MAG TPA: hypothetical protein VEK79_07795 [Thermoanaerobaculia bacterium]|nr:hypothetical protein [Thermoanaerobaculia bacterium]